MWQSADPIDRFNPSSPTIGLNLYQYGLLNPVRYTDPLGFDEVDQVKQEKVLGFMPPNAPLVMAGKAFAGLTAVAVGKATGDEALVNTAMEGMAADKQANVEAVAIMATMGRGSAKPGTPMGPRPVAGKPTSTPPTSGNAPDFVVTPSGTAIPVPKGATGPTPVVNPQGKTTGTAYTGGSGGHGMDPRVSNVRIMDPTPPKGPSPGYPGGYVNYQNASGQSVNPATGKTISPSDPSWHIPLR